MWKSQSSVRKMGVSLCLSASVRRHGKYFAEKRRFAPASPLLNALWQLCLSVRMESLHNLTIAGSSLCSGLLGPQLRLSWPLAFSKELWVLLSWPLSPSLSWSVPSAFLLASFFGDVFLVITVRNRQARSCLLVCFVVFLHNIMRNCALRTL